VAARELDNRASRKTAAPARKVRDGWASFDQVVSSAGTARARRAGPPRPEPGARGAPDPAPLDLNKA